MRSLDKRHPHSSGASGSASGSGVPALAVVLALATVMSARPAHAEESKPATPEPTGTPAPTPTPGAPEAPAPSTDPGEPGAAATAKVAPADKERAVYLSVDLGVTRADVGGLSDSTGFDKTGANGSAFGVGVGYRHKGFRVGGRFRDVTTTEYSLWSLMGEVGYGLSFRPISPTFFIHGGYMFDVGVERSAIASSLPRTNVLTPTVDLSGAVVGGELVASYWLTSFLRLGPFLGFDAMWLNRAKANAPQSLLPQTDETRSKPLFSDSGSGVGYMFTIGIRGTGDIAF